ncbi:MAG TPA: AAA family ATPase, partial [Pilimelia sp.]|nr:AAA family ATPase [Pilimelia sp.]
MPITGRDVALTALRGAVARLVAGLGAIVWIEGEAGIGKSTLIEATTAEASAHSCQVYRVAGDELGRWLPMRAPLDGLDPEVATEVLEGRNRDPGERGLGVAVEGSIPAAIESLERSVSRSARTAPVLLAFDDIQWADEPSLLAWHRLGRLARRTPLLLVSACRPVPVRPIVAGLRRAAVAGGATVLPLGPLTDGEVASLVAGLAGAAPGPRLRGALAQAGGNPRFARDIFDAVVRGGQVRVAAGTAELVGPEDEPPAGLGEAIGHRLDYLSLEALPVLRVAAVLGTEFSVYDLATVLGCPAGALLPVLDEATAAGVLGDVGDRLRFRHGVVRQAFYETTPLSARSALHRQVARALVEAGLPGERVAAHLAVAPDTVDDWAVDWLAEQAAALADRTPDLAARLLPAAAQRCPATDHRREPLVRGLARALYRLNRLDEAEAVARHAGAVATDPARAAETAWLLASILLAAGRYVDALPVLDGSLVRADVPALWRARLLAWRAKVLPYAGRREVAEAAARRALADGEGLADRVTIGHALHTLHLLAGHETG